MNAIDILDSHEKDAAWTQLFFLTDRNEAGDYLYYMGLTVPERSELIAFFQDILEDKRVLIGGDRFGTPDETPTERPADAVVEGGFKGLGLRADQYSFGKHLDWIPWAEDAKSGAKRGRYAQGYPRGLVLHWTAGHRNGLERGNELMRDTGMLYLVGDKDGGLAQSDSLKYHGYHAGVSSHKFASGYVSDEYVGLELQAAGSLSNRGGNFYSWFGSEIPRNEVVISKGRENIAAGNYHVYTPAQMQLVRQLCVWLYLNNPEVFSIDRVVGHDEVSPGRKVDPGGSNYAYDAGKDQTMSELRAQLWNDVDYITENAKRMNAL